MVLIKICLFQASFSSMQSSWRLFPTSKAGVDLAGHELDMEHINSGRQVEVLHDVDHQYT